MCDVVLYNNHKTATTGRAKITADKQLSGLLEKYVKHLHPMAGMEKEVTECGHVNIKEGEEGTSDMEAEDEESIGEVIEVGEEESDEGDLIDVIDSLDHPFLIELRKHPTLHSQSSAVQHESISIVRVLCCWSQVYFYTF